MASEFPAGDRSIAIGYQQPVVLLGSCFSEHISAELQKAGFTVSSNAFGVVFHPIALAKSLTETIRETVSERVLQREDIFLSWDASSDVYALSETALRSRLEEVRTELRSSLQQASTLIVTLGSAHGYRLKESGEIVANCHKIPADNFTKELTPLDELVESWSEALSVLKALNPVLQCVFTVSPVRYSRDGWIANNRSKARLFELCGILEERFGTAYFPAYELVNDLLRDYRYFAKDGVHPNEQAIGRVWELFGEWYFDPATKQVVNEITKLRQMENHRLLFPESAASAKFLEHFQREKERFIALHPYVKW